MSTIITRKVNGSGPYAYRVTWVPAEESHDWEYLGPAGKVDPAELTDDEIAQLRDENFGISRYRETQTGELYKRPIANDLRDEFTDRFGEDVLAPTDDRRSSKVELAEDAPPAAKRLLSGRSSDMRVEMNAGSGQAPLTDAEKKRLDFTGDANVMNARAAKAAILDEGVDDWTAVYDPTLNVSENREAAKNNRASVSGDRMDNDQEGPSQEGTGFEEARSEMEQQAVEGAKQGYEEARDVLVEDHGWSEAAADEVLAA